MRFTFEKEKRRVWVGWGIPNTIFFVYFAFSGFFSFSKIFSFPVYIYVYIA